MGTILIAGAGEAGLQVATGLRELGYDGRVVLVGGESRPPYQRPPLSKGFLAGSVQEDDLELRDASYLADQRIELLLGQPVVDVDLDDGGVSGGTALLEDGTRLEFDRLALATGSRPRRLPLQGADADGVLTLRTVADARGLRDQLDRAQDVVVIGGGFIGLEIAATARAQGKHVTVVEAADRVLARVVASPVSDHVQGAHRASGIEFFCSTTVAALATDDDNRVSAVVLGDGRRLPADLVVVGIGAEPCVELALGLGLDIERGITTDAHGRTGRAGVVAVGDCTVQPHPHRPGEWLSVESVNNAVEQGRAAAAVLIDREPAPRGVPWFWSNQGELKLQMVGISHGHDQHVVRQEAGDGRLTVLYYRGGRLIAADVVNNPRDFNAVKSALSHGATIDPAKAVDTGTALKSLITLAG